MKIFSVVGIRAAGKTTTITQLIEAFTLRGWRVGTVKTIFCPTFTLDDPKSNTYRHRQAGAAMICAKAKAETTIMLPRALTNSEILSHYADMDYVILEGDYLAPVPRLVAAHGEADAQPRINEHTLAVVGRAAVGQSQVLGLPAFDALTDPEALVDYLERHVADTPLAELDKLLEEDPAVTGNGFCQCGCHKHEKMAAKGQGLMLTLDGAQVALTPAKRQQILDLLAWDAGAVQS